MGSSKSTISLVNDDSVEPFGLCLVCAPAIAGSSISDPFCMQANAKGDGSNQAKSVQGLTALKAFPSFAVNFWLAKG